MPSVRGSKSPTKDARAAPYPASRPTDDTANQQPVPSTDNTLLPSEPPPASESTSAQQRTPAPKDDTATKGQSAPQGSYLDIKLREYIGHWGEREVPCYENARLAPAALYLTNFAQPRSIRHRLNTILNTKVKIPGTDESFTKTSMSAELCKIALAHHPIKSSAGIVTCEGPSVHDLVAFLREPSSTDGDSTTYYYGTMLINKMRIWNSRIKIKARQEAERNAESEVAARMAGEQQVQVPEQVLAPASRDAELTFPNAHVLGTVVVANPTLRRCC
ncbi:hypothetical protein C7974DRAFT_380814 [Boeremia exigua]|uniref:uncharacterized protein n=1 Tax=Boeremia exigua TaxID=749465 RepID=UPI001E8E6C65|nr:uncharacterized protein C7974DRAFT_380814 [Boeremia exigua]KAH6613104.1 hypothetical protein C7974DRAFT_380814 [Boeremia exigua]